MWGDRLVFCVPVQEIVFASTTDLEGPSAYCRSGHLAQYYLLSYLIGNALSLPHWVNAFVACGCITDLGHAGFDLGLVRKWTDLGRHCCCCCWPVLPC